MKRIFCILCICCFFLTSCKGVQEGEGVLVVTTNFPAYDFVRQIAGDNVNVTMLIKPGSDVHSYEPSPSDMVAISGCDLFVYTGGENDGWAEEILESAGEISTVKMLDCVDVISGAHEHEVDEHVWTSPLNAAKIAEEICQRLCHIDGENSGYYKENTAAFVAELQRLDGEFQQIADASGGGELVFADRFPMRYFADRYSLSFVSPFAGCAHDTEASPSAVADIIDMVKSHEIPVVLYGEMSDRKLAKAVSLETGAKMRLFHSCHNLSKEDFESGRTYLDIMKDNKEVLKEALGL